jgi:hypothetical protein
VDLGCSGYIQLTIAGDHRLGGKTREIREELTADA